MIKTYEGNDKYIFASYRHADAERVYPILEEFEKFGLRFWYDAGIHTGDEWDVVIDEHIEHSHAVIVFVSRAYFQSRNCREELKFARNLEKRLLLVYLEDAEIPRGLRMRISGVQAIYYHQYAEKKDFYEKFFQTPEIRTCRDEVQVPEISNVDEVQVPEISNEDEAQMPESGNVGKTQPVERVERQPAAESEPSGDERMQAVPKKAIKAKILRQKKRLEAQWNALPGGKYLRVFLNLFFTIEILMLLMANVVVLEGYLQYRYFHFSVAGCKFILSADGIRIAVGVIAAILLMLGILFFRKRMKSFWKYIVWAFVSVALFINMGIWQNMQAEIVRKHASPMEDMHNYMEMSDTQRGSFYVEFVSDILTISRDTNLEAIRQIEKEFGISWEEWDVTVMAETNAAPCEYALYQGKHVDNGDRIEVRIPLSKQQYEYGMLTIELEGVKGKGVNLIFGKRPAVWYQELLYKSSRMYEAANYERLFSKGSWEWIAKSDAVEVGLIKNIAWTALISSPEIASIGVLLLGMAAIYMLWYPINLRVLTKIFDEIEAGAGKRMYVWIAAWGVGSFAALMFVMYCAIERLVEWIFKLI